MLSHVIGVPVLAIDDSACLPAPQGRALTMLKPVRDDDVILALGEEEELIQNGCLR